MIIMQLTHSVCTCIQIAHTFFDAPGALAATFIEPQEAGAEAANDNKPYITMVFCGPADYKVHPARFCFACLLGSITSNAVSQPS